MGIVRELVDRWVSRLRSHSLVYRLLWLEPEDVY